MRRGIERNFFAWKSKGIFNAPGIYYFSFTTAKSINNSSILIQQFFKAGNQRLIPVMEHYYSEIPLQHVNINVQEARVKFYLQSDIKSKATEIIRQYKANYKMLLELFDFHLRNKSIQSANDNLHQLSQYLKGNADKSTSAFIICELIDRLLDNDQYETACGLLSFANSTCKSIELQETASKSSFFDISKLIFNSSVELDRERIAKKFMSFYFRKQMPQQADFLLQSCKTFGLQFDTNFYNLLLEGYVRTKNISKIQSTISSIRSLNMPFNISTYNQLLQFHSNQADEGKVLQECAEILNTMTTEKVHFNDETFAIMIRKMIRFFNFAQIFEIFSQLKQSQTILSIEVIQSLTVEFQKAKLDAGIGLLIEHCRHFSLIPNLKTYNRWISYLLERFEINEAFRLLHEALHLNALELNRETFRILLEHFASTLEINSCKQILKEMSRLSIPLDNSHYSALMSLFYFVCDPSTNPRLMLMIPFQSPSKHGKWHLLSLKNESMMDLAIVEKTFVKIFNIPFEITVHSYNQLLIHTLKTKQLDEFSLIYENMLKKGSKVLPNKITFLLKIKALILLHDADAARNVINEMNRCGLDVPTIAYALIFHYFCRKADCVEAEKLLESFEAANNFRINFVIYSSLLYAYMRKQDYSNVVSTFNRLESRFLLTDTETHNYLIEAHFRLQQPEEALGCFEKMQAQGIPRNWFTYSILIFNLIRLDMVPLIYEKILPDCSHTGNSISCISFDRLMCFHLNQSHLLAVERLLVMMQELQVRFNHSSISFLSVALKNIIMKGALETAVRLCYKISTDFPPANPYIEELFEHVLQWMQQSGTEIDVDMYTDAVSKIRTAYRKGLLLIAPANPIISFGLTGFSHS